MNTDQQIQQKPQSEIQQLKRALRQARAEKILDKSIQTDESLKKALLSNKFGCMCLQAGKYNLALKYLNEALKIFEEIYGQYVITNVYMNLGNLAGQMKQYSDAIEFYRIVITHSIYLNEKQQDQLSILWSGRLNSYEAFCDAYTNLACLLANTNQIQEAYDICLVAIQMNPFNSEAQINFGDILRQIGKNQQAIEHTWSQIVNTTNQIAKEQIYQKPQQIQCDKIPQQITQQNIINIVCVKWGTKYDASYVNKLYYGIKRNTNRTFKFHCFTDDNTNIDEQISIHPLMHGWTGWWGKATLFNDSAENLQGKQVFIDLDMIITGNVDNILDYNGNFGILKTDDIHCEKGNKNGYNSSIMIWSSNKLFKSIYDELEKNQEQIRKYIVRFDFWLEMMVKNADYLQDLYPSQIKDYMQECQQELPLNTKIVCFPRTPKPHEAKAEWIQQKWIL